MNSLLFGISISALLSTTSFIIVLIRVSPLTAPEQAVPALFVSMILSISTVMALVLYGLWKLLPMHTWDEGRLLSISLRQGTFLGIGTALLLTFHMLNLLTWWIGIMIYAFFLLVELALDH